MVNFHRFVSIFFLVSLFSASGTVAREEASVSQLNQLRYLRNHAYRPHLASNERGQAAVIWKHAYSRAVWISTFNGRSWGAPSLINKTSHRPIETIRAEREHRNPSPPIRFYREEPPPPEVFVPPPSPEKPSVPRPYPLLRPQVTIDKSGAITVAWLQADPGTNKVYLWVNHKSWDARGWPKPIKAAFVAQFKKGKIAYRIFWNEYASFKLLPTVANQIRLVFARSVRDKATTHFFYKWISVKAFSSNFEEKGRARPLYRRTSVINAGMQWDAAADSKGNISLVWNEGDWQGSSGAAWGSIYDQKAKKWSRPTLIQPDNDEVGPWANAIRTQLVHGYAVATWTWRDHYSRKTKIMGNVYDFEKRKWQGPSTLSEGLKKDLEYPLLATNGKTIALGFTERWTGEKVGWKNRANVWGRIFKQGRWQQLVRCNNLGKVFFLNALALNKKGTLFASGVSLVGKYRKNLWTIKAETEDKLEWSYPDILYGDEMVPMQMKRNIIAEGKKWLIPNIAREDFKITTWRYNQYDIQIAPGRSNQATLAWTSRLHLLNAARKEKYEIGRFHIIHTTQFP